MSTGIPGPMHCLLRIGVVAHRARDSVAAGRRLRCTVSTIARTGAAYPVLPLVVLLWAVPLEAQELRFLSDDLRSGPHVCEDVPAPLPTSLEARAQAADLMSGADQAVLLGELPRALALLDRAVELNPGSADLAYRRARVLESLTERRAAVDEYCRALSLSPDGELVDARSRMDGLVAAERETVPEEAILAFETGLAAGAREAMSEALESFERAATWAPGWAIAEYNRGVALALLGRGPEAGIALLRYLELRPDAPNALAVARRIGEMESVSARAGPSPRVAVALGLLVPGMGHFYAGRPVEGMTVLAIAGGAIAAGLLVEQVDVRCLTAVEGGPCPEDQVVSRTSDRPYLWLGIGAAAGVGVLGAVEAFFRARGTRARLLRAQSHAGGSSVLVGPAVRSRADRVELRLFGLRVR